jgi:hypothetical protein
MNVSPFLSTFQGAPQAAAEFTSYGLVMYNYYYVATLRIALSCYSSFLIRHMAGLTRSYYFIFQFYYLVTQRVLVRRAREIRLGFKGDAARSMEQNVRYSKMRFILLILLYYYYSIHTMQIFYLSVKWYIYYM